MRVAEAGGVGGASRRGRGGYRTGTLPNVKKSASLTAASFLTRASLHNFENSLVKNRAVFFIFGYICGRNFFEKQKNKIFINSRICYKKIPKKKARVALKGDACFFFRNIFRPEMELKLFFIFLF